MNGINLLHGCFFDKIKEIDSNSISIIITDPPYFLDKLDDNWNIDVVNSKKSLKVVKSLPRGMKFDKTKGKELYKWYFKVSKELFRVLKDGGFFFTFSSPRLYHRIASAVDDAGFEIRDMFSWLYTQNQPKAMSLDHIIKKQNFSDEQKRDLISKLKNWKTPQIKSCFEPICLAQKPIDKNYLNNFMNNQVGLMNTKTSIGADMFPANVVTDESIGLDKYFLVGKPSKKEKGEFNHHKTVKPLDVIKYLISLSSYSNTDIIFDPFMGSGTTGVACESLNRQFIGFELNREYFEVAEKRLSEKRKNLASTLFS